MFDRGGRRAEEGMGELRSAVDALNAVDPDTLDPAELGALLAEVAGQQDRLAAVRARLTAAHDRLLAWKIDGARSQKDWLTERCRLAPGVAGRQSRDARHLAQLPRTAEAFADGTITAPKPPPPPRRWMTCPPRRSPGSTSSSPTWHPTSTPVGSAPRRHLRPPGRRRRGIGP